LLDWEFAFAVFKLNHHTLSGLLQRAGLKHRRPRWDYFPLLIAALLFVVATIALILPAGMEPWTLFKWVGIGCGYVGIPLLLYFASRRIEERQLEKDIERCRLASRFVTTLAG